MRKLRAAKALTRKQLKVVKAGLTTAMLQLHANDDGTVAVGEAEAGAEAEAKAKAEAAPPRRPTTALPQPVQAVADGTMSIVSEAEADLGLLPLQRRSEIVLPRRKEDRQERVPSRRGSAEGVEGTTKEKLYQGEGSVQEGGRQGGGSVKGLALGKRAATIRQRRRRHRRWWSCTIHRAVVDSGELRSLRGDDFDGDYVPPQEGAGPNNEADEKVLRSGGTISVTWGRNCGDLLPKSGRGHVRTGSAGASGLYRRGRFRAAGVVGLHRLCRGRPPRHEGAGRP